MRKFLRSSALLLAVLAGTVCLWGCGTSDSKPRQDAKKPVAQDPSSAAQERQTALQDQHPVEISPVVLVDQDGIVITAEKLVEDPIWGKGVQFLVENHSSESVIIQCDDAVVNQFMMPSVLFSTDVAAGKQSRDVLYFPQSTLEEVGIATIQDMAFVFYAVDPNTLDRRFTTEEVSLRTSAEATEDAAAPLDGVELYHQDGFRVVGRYVHQDSIWGTSVVLYVENEGRADALLTCEQMSINGNMVTPFFATRVNKGRKCIASITITDADLQKYGIEKVQDIEMVLRGVSPQTYETIFETAPLRMKIEQ